MISGSREDGLVWCSHPPPACGMTTTQTCEALQQSHRLLGDTYIKHKAAPHPLLASLSHGGACEKNALSVLLPSIFSFAPDGAARHPDRHQTLIAPFLMLDDRG